MAPSLSSEESPRELSAVDVESGLVARLYDNISTIYDVAFGPVLQPGRRRAVAAMGETAGQKILEVGVGTGLNLSLYRAGTDVTGIDFSPQMLDQAEARAAREGLEPRLFEMDAADLRFADESFDIVYAPYLITVVPDPVRVLREMQRVCRPGGRVLVLSHFRSPHPVYSWLERRFAPLSVKCGFRVDLDMAALFAQAGFSPDWTERVNWPRIWTLAQHTRPSPPG